MNSRLPSSERGEDGSAPRTRILIVEDDELVRLGLSRFLGGHGFDLVTAESCAEAEDLFLLHRPAAVLVDFRLPDGTALDLLARLRAGGSTVPFVILTGHGSVELAVQSIKQGAENFLTKPVEMPALLAMLRRLTDGPPAQTAARAADDPAGADPFAGNSPAIRRFAEQARRIAARDSSVLILGETGSGKGVLARWLHSVSRRAAEPFVDLNCAGLARDLLETELFGHEKGAFSGAVALKHGLFEVAHRGAIFLDEIGELHPEVQPKLLKVLEEKRFRRLGGVRDQLVDVRLIAATHRDLAALADAGGFRRDLYFRINSLPLRVPPLRERQEDIAVLARHLVAQLGHAHGEQRELRQDAVQALLGYSWPGNIRELRNVLERAILLSDDELLTARDLRLDEWRGATATSAPAPLLSFQPDATLAAATAPETDAELAAPEAIGAISANDANDASDANDAIAAAVAGAGDLRAVTLADIERRRIEQVLSEEGGQVAAAARRLGISRSGLYNKIQKYGLASSFWTPGQPATR